MWGAVRRGGAAPPFSIREEDEDGFDPRRNAKIREEDEAKEESDYEQPRSRISA